MKRTRKGFTLLELLVVIGVMGILSSTAMIAGQQATDGARATTIAEGLEKAASAMMMYYADNAEVIAVEGVAAEATVTEAKLVTGTNAYLKTTMLSLLKLMQQQANIRYQLRERLPLKRGGLFIRFLQQT